MADENKENAQSGKRGREEPTTTSPTPAKKRRQMFLTDYRFSSTGPKADFQSHKFQCDR